MKLYMKQKVFTFNDKFTIKDENGNDKYKVEGEFFSFMKKLHVFNMEGREVAFIQEKFSFGMPKFKVFVEEEEIAEIKQKLTFFKPKFEIAGKNWKVNGNIWGHEYTISNSEGNVAKIEKEWMTWGDSYLIDINDSQDEISVMTVVLAIDAVMTGKN
ncbi:hypothetical protein EII29_10355 [Leptotrichia sp. OH3620_COT-345]|uniref:LURP-one-related/scramblase family protein n=1 Tax=Leptotrichia sp. OH3620_COT-345 TaxID=2491048 RepID=UPI000F64D343|nr:LURP-one-related family protein [Leptotrichia sp. OH3620_COT-345]RRD38434.1 hypothetical protein EII29_10355 [Leptotrichia sp. OH3620_COT-345]